MGEHDTTPAQVDAPASPAPFGWLRGYQFGSFLGPDILAGVALAALLVPESIGYAQVAGLPPEVGLFAAPLALLAYAALGTSRVAVVATASAVSAVSASVVGAVAGTDVATFVALSAALAIMSGLVYMAVGLARMGWIANFMSRAVVDGFIIGLALFIIAGQLDGLVGVEVDGEFALARAVDWVLQVGDWNIATLVVGLVALAALFAMEEWAPALPAALVVMALGMLAAALTGLEDRGVEVVGSLPTGLPQLGLPSVDGSSLLRMVPGALAVTLVGFSEGFAAVNAFVRGGERLDVDRELVAFGASNVGSGLSSGMVVGASLSKTAAVHGAGARTQMANVVAGIVVVAALLFIGPVFAYLPEAVLAAVVIHAVVGLVNADKLRRIRQVDQVDFWLAVMVLVGTLLLEPVQAVVLGVVVSLGVMIRQVSFPTVVELGLNPSMTRSVVLADHPGVAGIVPGVVVVRMDAPLVYSNAATFQAGVLDLVAARAADVTAASVVGVVVNCESMATIDSAGVETMADLVTALDAQGIALRLARVHTPVHAKLVAGGVLDEIGPDAVHDRVRDAVVDLTSEATLQATAARLRAAEQPGTEPPDPGPTSQPGDAAPTSQS